MNVIPETRRPH